MRQSNDVLYAQMLNRIRIGRYTAEDIEMLKSRLTHPSKISDPTVLHIYPTKKEVAEHNRNMQLSLNSIIYRFKATHIFSSNDIGKNTTVTESFIPDDNRDAGGLPLQIDISIGTKVMLIRNLNVALVNGAIGMIDIIPQQDNDNTTIYVSFPNLNIPNAFSSSRNVVAIPKYNQEYLYNGRFVIITNYPLIPCWATTIHKVQELSLKSAAISIGASIFQKGQSYVALSRVESLENMYLLSFCENKLKCDPDVINEYLSMYINNRP
ncbi:PIF1 [Mytilus coruscus]|uniref:PIF1 n=1 Tax=Mytilus coruscus TaxID=42192 RepID=A0A6J8E313_MYTCO|nr:PIF1 [Mytilus coruscus]